MAQSTPEIHFFGAPPRTPPGLCPWTPLGGGGAYSAPPPPPIPPSCWLLATLVCNALRALHNALRVLSILCLRYFPAFSFHESCIPEIGISTIPGTNATFLSHVRDTTMRGENFPRKQCATLFDEIPTDQQKFVFLLSKKDTSSLTKLAAHALPTSKPYAIKLT